jgi:hypothetical protein
MENKYKLTQQEQQNVNNGLTTDGRVIDHCDDRTHCSCGCGAHMGCFFISEEE